MKINIIKEASEFEGLVIFILTMQREEDRLIELVALTIISLQAAFSWRRLKSIDRAVCREFV